MKFFFFIKLNLGWALVLASSFPNPAGPWTPKLTIHRSTSSYTPKTSETILKHISPLFKNVWSLNIHSLIHSFDQQIQHALISAFDLASLLSEIFTFHQLYLDESFSSFRSQLSTLLPGSYVSSMSWRIGFTLFVISFLV